MKRASCVNFLDADGVAFGVHLGKNGWCEHEHDPNGLYWSMKATEAQDGAMVADCEAMRSVLKYGETQGKGTVISAFGMDRLHQYRKSTTWLQGVMKYEMPADWAVHLRLRGSKAAQASPMNGVVAKWCDNEFLVMAAGVEQVARLRVLASTLMSGQMSMTRNLLVESDESLMAGLILFRRDLAPDGWDRRMAETKVLNGSVQEWISRYRMSAAQASSSADAART